MTLSNTERNSQLRTEENQKTKPESTQKRLTCLFNRGGKQVCVWLGHPVCTFPTAWWPCKSFQNISCVCPIHSQASRAAGRYLQHTHRQPCFVFHMHMTYSTGSKNKIRRDIVFFILWGLKRWGWEPLSKDICLTSRICVFKHDTAYSPTNGNCKLFSQCPKWAAVDCACQMDKDGTGRQGNQISSFSELFKAKSTEQNIFV